MKMLIWVLFSQYLNMSKMEFNYRKIAFQMNDEYLKSSKIEIKKFYFEVVIHLSILLKCPNYRQKNKLQNLDQINKFKLEYEITNPKLLKNLQKSPKIMEELTKVISSNHLNAESIPSNNKTNSITITNLDFYNNSLNYDGSVKNNSNINYNKYDKIFIPNFNKNSVEISKNSFDEKSSILEKNIDTSSNLHGNSIPATSNINITNYPYNNTPYKSTLLFDTKAFYKKLNDNFKCYTREISSKFPLNKQISTFNICNFQIFMTNSTPLNLESVYNIINLRKIPWLEASWMHFRKPVY